MSNPHHTSDLLEKQRYIFPQSLHALLDQAVADLRAVPRWRIKQKIPDKWRDSPNPDFDIHGFVYWMVYRDGSGNERIAQFGPIPAPPNEGDVK